MKEHELFGISMQGCRERSWPGRSHASTLGDVHWYIVGRPSIHGSPCHGGRVKAAGGLPAKVGTTRLSCGVSGRNERPLVTVSLTMKRCRPRVVYPRRLARLACRVGW
ncbi:hypothetical protein CRG98_030322 [Punica granatum]|uniref:Uncharacterized protein n=1 Tax=Punica granatum TaxID=22663 RepID=A0A2I0IZ54_PUNGR|nr:hypothetical protein CRG98_030322 [Punica granatum]